MSSAGPPRGLAIAAAATSAAGGSEVQILGPTRRGESSSTFNVLVSGHAAVLKVLDGGPGVLENQQRLVRLVDTLRSRGSPVPEYLGVGETDGVVVTLQQQMPGDPLERRPGAGASTRVLASTLPSILAAVDLQSGAGDLAVPSWPDWLLTTITVGGDGYCLHDTMRRRSDTASILERVQQLASDHSHADVAAHDIIHFDLNPANVLHERGRLTGIVDWNVPFDGGSQGDRGFDVATLLFYTYDTDAFRDPLWERATAISGSHWVAVYLAHIVLRQVEWTIRHRPGSAEERRFLRIAHHVLHDCEQLTS